MDNHIDLLINPKKIYVPKYNNNQNINEYKTNILNELKNHNINFDRKINSNIILDLLYFIQFHNKFKNCLCDDCKEKIKNIY